MDKTTRVGIGLLALATVSACDNNPRSEALGGGEPCVGSFLDGSYSASANACTICGSADPERTIDGSRSSYGSRYQTSGTYSLRAVAPSGVIFPAGNFAGALMRIPVGYSPGTTWTISTYLGGVPQESRGPANASGGNPANPTGEDDYYGFIASSSFDSVEVSMAGGTTDTVNISNTPVRIYEFCGQR